MPNEAIQQHFGRLAQRYDELRSPSELVTPLIETLVAAGDMRGRRVLDIGCGTGRTLAALALHYEVQGWGIDASTEMLEVARAQVPPTVTLQQSTAEELPFSESFFERVYMTMVIHFLNRAVVFPEIWRVLQPGGRVTIMTPDLASFERNWLTPFFPSYVRVEHARFPSGETIAAELTHSGFIQPSSVPLHATHFHSKEAALRRIRERHISTFALLDDDEYREGLARAERELPEMVESVQQMLFISADKPA